MSTYGEYINRVTWNMLCKRILAKSRMGSVYGITAQPRGYGKTMTTRALYRAITAEFVVK